MGADRRINLPLLLQPCKTNAKRKAGDLDFDTTDLQAQDAFAFNYSYVFCYHYYYHTAL